MPKTTINDLKVVIEGLKTQIDTLETEIDESKKTKKIENRKFWVQIIFIIIGTYIAYNSFQASSKAAEASAKSAEASAKSLEESIKQAKDDAVARIYAENYEPTKIFIQYPETIKFFFKDAREDNLTDDELMKQFYKLSLEKQNQIILIAELNADVGEKTFLKRADIPDCDWLGWWKFYTDLYDESPVFKDLLQRRQDWYEIVGAIGEKRKKYRNREDLGRQLNESLCIGSGVKKIN